MTTVPIGLGLPALAAYLVVWSTLTNVICHLQISVIPRRSSPRTTGKGKPMALQYNIVRTIEVVAGLIVCIVLKNRDLQTEQAFAP